LKVFKTTKPLDSLETGDVVDVIGKVREYEGETYVIPEIARKTGNPNFELLRRLELIYKEKGIKKAKDFVERNKGKDQEELEKGSEKIGLEKQWVETFLTGGEKEGREKSVLKKEILKAIESSPEGIVYSELTKRVKAKETDLESAIDELLNDGICYEPSPGKIRKI